MKKNDLVNRTRFSNAIRNDLKIAFDDLAKETKIPKSILLDEAVELLLKKHDKDIPNQ